MPESSRTTKTQAFKKNGIIYQASRSYKYVLDAALSALSARRVGYNGPICLFTNLDLPMPPPELISEIIQSGPVKKYASKWVTGKFPKLQALQNSPYSRTLYIDTDTRILNAGIKDFPRLLFSADLLMVRVSPHNSFCAKALNTDIYNAGVIAFKQTPTVMDLFSQWEAHTHKHHKLLEDTNLPSPEILAGISDPKKRQKLLKMDQLGLYELLNPQLNQTGVSFQEMGAVWNYRERTTVALKETIIHHHNRYRKNQTAEAQQAIQALQAEKHDAIALWLQKVLDLWQREKLS
ncbi:hypothetical protein [Kordiimonas pumila]|uniref:Nucleotide-diphospho-sugar transferase domain-containing protein n=1 Tax=Kordiimonas pumila TaxID=2161677 RepID=A0ABV7D7W1_9PROT|nr:hypothetical protein [Kordiimonas pumila]